MLWWELIKLELAAISKETLGRCTLIVLIVIIAIFIIATIIAVLHEGRSLRKAPKHLKKDKEQKLRGRHIRKKKKKIQLPPPPKPEPPPFVEPSDEDLPSSSGKKEVSG